MKTIFLLLALLIAAVVVFFTSGCEILKTRQEVKADSTHVAKTVTVNNDSVNAGNVKKTDEKSKDSYEWWRMIVPGKDTNIVNNNFYPQPATIIYEGGKGVREESKQTTDSSWLQRILQQMTATLDSNNVRLQKLETSKHSETKGLGLWAMIALLVGVYIVLNIGGYAIKNFTITKK